MQEPRGRPVMCVNFVLPLAIQRPIAGLLIMVTEEYPAMSGGNAIATTTVLLETGMVAMTEPITKIVLETPAGLVPITADCEGGKCEEVAFNTVSSFVFALDYKIDVPTLGFVSVDIAWGGMINGFVDATSLGISINNKNGPKLIEYGEGITDALQKAPFVPVHPENPGIRGVSILQFTEPLYWDTMMAVNTVVVSPGRFDRCPCGTGSCARMAVLHARGQLAVDEEIPAS
ncbi:Diaminopimelate epimerase-like protein [Aspergillus niger ATCC 13496]|nr:Diaminopimelate epimerase-like protein [Aspergillus niger ATCC 13496]